MGGRVGLIFLLVLGAGWASDARELVTSNLFTSETESSDVSVLQINHQDSEREIQVLEEVGKKPNVCKLCEEFSVEVLKYLVENKTQTEVMKILLKSCSKMRSLKQECITLVDYYAPLFFLKISSIQPGELCQKFGLCGQMVVISQRLSKDSCDLCQYTVAEALLKLKEPDTQLEIMELLLKGCGAVETYVKKCKKMVFEYGPMILATTKQMLETSDICTMLHACDSPTANIEQAFIKGQTSVLSKY